MSFEQNPIIREFARLANFANSSQCERSGPPKGPAKFATIASPLGGIVANLAGTGPRGGFERSQLDTIAKLAAAL